MNFFKVSVSNLRLFWSKFIAKLKNFVVCVVMCVNHSRTNSLCCQIWYLAKLNIRTLWTRVTRFNSLWVSGVTNASKPWIKPMFTIILKLATVLKSINHWLLWPWPSFGQGPTASLESVAFWARHKVLKGELLPNTICRNHGHNSQWLILF